VLSGEGYELVGGRLLPGETGAVAQFMYQDAKGKRLTLYVSRLAGKQRDTAFRFSQEDKVSVFYWIDGALGYALSGELPKAELLKVATTVYKQLNP
jgi:anti-sigma factor RsiW